MAILGRRQAVGSKGDGAAAGFPSRSKTLTVTVAPCLGFGFTLFRTIGVASAALFPKAFTIRCAPFVLISLLTLSWDRFLLHGRAFAAVAEAAIFPTPIQAEHLQWFFLPASSAAFQLISLSSHGKNLPTPPEQLYRNRLERPQNHAS